MNNGKRCFGASSYEIKVLKHTGSSDSYQFDTFRCLRSTNVFKIWNKCGKKAWLSYRRNSPEVLTDIVCDGNKASEMRQITSFKARLRDYWFGQYIKTMKKVPTKAFSPARTNSSLQRSLVPMLIFSLFHIPKPNFLTRHPDGPLIIFLPFLSLLGRLWWENIASFPRWGREVRRMDTDFRW